MKDNLEEDLNNNNNNNNNNKNPSWNEERKNFITASDAGTAVGLGKFKPYALWEVKTNKIERTEDENSSTIHGKRFEPLVKNFYEKITQNCVEEVGLTDHPCISYLAATPDGFVKVDKESKESILIEIKAPQFAEWDWIPVEHMAQIQLQLEVFNIKCCDYVCYFQNKSIVKVWRIYRSPVYWKWMSSRLALFWKSVCENQPPSEKEIPFIYQQATELEKNHYNYSILDSSLPRNILPPKVFYKLLTVEKWEEIQTTPPPTIDSSIFFQFIFFIFVILLSFFLLFFYS